MSDEVMLGPTVDPVLYRESRDQHIAEAEGIAEANGWKRIPDSEGDWLWVEMWSCACCIRNSGVSWVQKTDEMPEGGLDLGNGFSVSWEKSRPDLDEHGRPISICGWKLVDLPPTEWSEAVGFGWRL